MSSSQLRRVFCICMHALAAVAVVTGFKIHLVKVAHLVFIRQARQAEASFAKSITSKVRWMSCYVMHWCDDALSVDRSKPAGRCLTTFSRWLIVKHGKAFHEHSLITSFHYYIDSPTDCLNTTEMECIRGRLCLLGPVTVTVMTVDTGFTCDRSLP